MDILDGYQTIIRLRDTHEPAVSTPNLRAYLRGPSRND